MVATERRMLTGNAAAAWGARLADVDYLPAFPITPQTEIVELLAEWCATRQMAARFVTLDSEHSMLTAAGAAAATGARVFTATSSQGLVYGLETLYTIAGWRVPLVIVNVSRGLSAPITLGPDHNDVLAARDTGLVQLHAASCQEALDFILLGYRIAEDPRVSTPVLVNFDGFFLSFTREPVDMPSDEQARAFLPPFASPQPTFRASQPMAHGVAVLDGATYSHFRYQLQLAVQNAAAVFDEAATEFAQHCGRAYEAVETYRLDDAEIVLVMLGSFTTKGRAAVDRWRLAGHRVGLLRPRLVRPLPAAALRKHLAGRRAVAVLDQNLSPGLGGILYHEVAGSLFGAVDRPPVLRSFIGGLGGKDISPAEFDHLLEVTRQTDPTRGYDATPELLMLESQWQQVQRAIGVAGCVEEVDHARGT